MKRGERDGRSHLLAQSTRSPDCLASCDTPCSLTHLRDRDFSAFQRDSTIHLPITRAAAHSQSKTPLTCSILSR